MNGDAQAAEWRTPEEVAAILKVPVETVRELVAERRLAAVRVGRELRFRPGALERYLEKADTTRPRWPWAARAALVAASAIALAGAVLVGAQSVDNGPHLLPYRGVLEQSGANVQSDSVQMTFQLYAAPTGGAPLGGWSEQQTVAVQDGQFSVAIGAQSPVPSSFFTQPSLYLQVAVNGQQLSGRQRLLGVPYAQAATAATNVVGNGTVNTTSVNASAVYAGSVGATGGVSAAAFSTGPVLIGAGTSSGMIGGGNGAGNLHIDSNLNNGADGRLYLNWLSGKGVVVGNGGLLVSDAAEDGNMVAGVENSGHAWFAGKVDANAGVRAQAIGVGTQDFGATQYPYETIQMQPGTNLRIWNGTTERFVLGADGSVSIGFDQGYWNFQSDGNLVKYRRSDGKALWASGAGW